LFYYYPNKLLPRVINSSSNCHSLWSTSS